MEFEEIDLSKKVVVKPRAERSKLPKPDPFITDLLDAMRDNTKTLKEYINIKHPSTPAPTPTPALALPPVTTTPLVAPPVAQQTNNIQPIPPTAPKPANKVPIKKVPAAPKLFSF